jgi:LmbE family N-acetylglucosaminyl deacetylase
MARRSVLAVGAHPDDIELGCGGALAKHVAAGDRVTMLVVTRGEKGPGESAQRVAEQQAAVDVLGVDRLIWGEGFLDCRVSLQEFELVHLIEDAIEQVSATVVYTHMDNDSHQDHRVVSRCTMGAARWVSTIMAYGGPSAVGFNPTAFIGHLGFAGQEGRGVDVPRIAGRGQREGERLVVRSTAEHYGFLCRRPFAEGFEPIRQVVDF